MYDGFWRAGKKHGLGVFRPAPEETTSRRHSNHTGWQPQQQRGSGAGSPEVPAPADLAAQSAIAEQELAVASVSSETHELQPGAAAATAVAAVAAAATPVDGVHLQDLRHIASAVPTTAPTTEQHQQQQGQVGIKQQQQSQQALCKQRSVGKPHLVSPFLAAAAVLNSGTSILGEPPRLANGSWQQPQAEAAAAAATAAAGGVDTFVGAAGADKALNAADAAGSSAAGAAAAPAGSQPGDTADSSALVPAVALSAGAAAPRKLFVREYNMGQLVREYPLTAEEIKMIFGFLWPKANKVCRGAL